jgi:hypothetical protein
MGRYTDTITFLIRDGNLLKPFSSISITVPKARELTNNNLPESYHFPRIFKTQINAD